MNRGVVALIALAVMGVAVMVAVADPSRNGQNAFMGIGLLASAVVVIAIIVGVGDSQGSARGDTQIENHIHNHPAPQAQQPIHYQQPAAAPQIVYIPMPQPSYPPMPQYALPPAAAPQYAHPGYLPAPQNQAYLPAPQGYHPAAIEHHQAQYRGALDVTAEPVHRAPQQQRIARGAVAQLESPQASLIRRVARRIVS